MRRILVPSLGAVALVGGLAAALVVAPCAPPFAALAGFGFGPARCAGPRAAEAPRAVAPPTVTVVAAVDRPFVDRLFVSGTLVAREEAQVAAQIDGLTIVEIDAEEGDLVAAGQLLARLDRSQIDAQFAQNDAATARADAAIAQAKSAIEQAQAQLSWASDDYDRAAKLGPQVIAAATIEQRETALRTARAQLASAQNALSVAEADRKSRDGERRELEVKLAETEVKAPVAGIVSRRTARLGAAVGGASEPLFRIIKDGAIDLEAEAPEQALPRLAVGMSAELALPGVARQGRRNGAADRRRSRQGEPHRQGARRARTRRAGPCRRLRLGRDRAVAQPGRRRAGERGRARRGGRPRAGGARRNRRAAPRLGRRRGGRRARDRRRRRGRRDGRRARRRVPAPRRPGDRGPRRIRGSDPVRLNVSAWSIRRPIPAAVGFVILTLLGIVAFRQMAVTRFPNIDIPIVQVVVTQSGAAPSELESQVTKKVEDAVSNVPGVWHMISTVTDGSSVTVVQFTVGAVDIDRALNDVKDQIAKIRSDLPRTIDEPIVSRIQAEGLPFVTYAASAPGMTAEQLSWFVDDTVARELQSVKGVGEVKRFGGVDREIRVALDPDKLLALGVTAAQVNAQLRADNIDLGGGRAELAGQEQAIRTLAGARTVADLAATPISLPGDRRVRLDELATVTDGAAEPRTFARLFDEPIVSFGVTRAKGASDVAVDRLVAARLARIQADHSEVSFAKVDTQVDNELGNYSSTMETLIEGALLAVIVVLVFLRDLRATIVTALALPLSILPTFWAMDAIGFSLNLVSLLAITLVTGILVDDAIVEIENIVRHMRMGKSAYRASLEAADEIGLAVIAISLTIVAIFSPVSFMSGIAGQYFRQFGLTVAIAVLFSLLVARFVTPVLAAYFLRAPEEPVHREGAIMRFYTRLVRASVRHRWITLAAGVMIFVASIAATKLLPSGFLPADDQGRALLALELPPGSRLADTDRVTRRISDQLKAMPEVRSVLIYGGEILGSGAEPRKATFVINFVNKSERAASQKDLQARIGAMLASTPDIRYWFVKDNGQRDLSLIVAGPDINAINDAADQLASEMRSIPTIENPISTAELDRPELRIVPKRQLAADLGVSTETLSETIRVATLGDVDANLAKFNAGDRLVPIRVELDEAARGDIGRLQDLRVPTGSGGAAPLSALADFVVDHGPTAINRYDRTRRVTIEATSPATPRSATPSTRSAPCPRRSICRQGSNPRDRRRRSDGRGVRLVRRGDRRRHDDGLRAAGAAVRQAPAADHHPRLAAAVGRRRDRRAAADPQGDVDARRHRHSHADGHRHQERDHAGRLRVEEIGRGTPRIEALVEAGTQARAADRHDDDRHGRRHVPLGAGPGRRRRLPLADGDRGDGRPAASTLLSLVFVPRCSR